MPSNNGTTAVSSTRSPHLPPDEVIFGLSAVMAAVRQRVEKVAAARIPVLIQGESGTGKEIIAKLIHRRSDDSQQPFVKVNCPAIPGTLLESELFGYEKGAFTGAYGNKPGRVELADGGTLFLDEIAELDMGLQAKLLQLLQDGQFSPIGSQQDKRVEVRVICATNRRIEQEIDAGTFRQDLFYRINVVNIQLPPLRQRREDIPTLVSYFLQHYRLKYQSDVPPLSPLVMQLLEQHHWPGNVRELENMIERYVILGSEESIGNELLSWDAAPTVPQIPDDGTVPLKVLTRQVVQELERKVILRVLEANRWNRKRSARALCISYRALLYKIRAAGLPPKKASARTRAAVEPSPSPAD